MNDPTYDQERINRDPVWREAFRLSEIGNDNAPIGWSQYIPAARELLDFKANAQADIDAVAGKLVVADQRVKLLEGIIREARAMALAGEWDEPMIAKALGAVFACDVCMDTGVSGGMPKGDENDSCCHACHLGGNPLAPVRHVKWTCKSCRRTFDVRPNFHACIASEPPFTGIDDGPERSIVHDGSGVAMTRKERP